MSVSEMRKLRMPGQEQKTEIVDWRPEAKQNLDLFANHNFRIEEYFQICLFFGSRSSRHTGGIPIPASDEQEYRCRSPGLLYACTLHYLS